MDKASYICCQLGAREHYAVARALAGNCRLRALITDLWMPPKLSACLPSVSAFSKLRERYHPALQGAPVRNFNFSFLGFELAQRAQGTQIWERIIARNRLFGQCAVHELTQIGSKAPSTIFAYSYAALEILRWAKQRGWRTVLGQIDPGPVHTDVVQQEITNEQEFGELWNSPPSTYWDTWREECSLADTIIVNSPWSLEALVHVGVPVKKLKIIPLAYEVPDELPLPKQYPVQFTVARPLRVLFLGQINLAKGVARLLEAARTMRDEAVEFWMVGPIHIGNRFNNNRDVRVRWIGPVTRGQATQYYQFADVFILPTLSDGFALTQLEAMAHRLPVIASANCGRVVRDGVDGRILPLPTAEAIAAALRECLQEPARLAEWSRAAGIRPEFTLASLARRLVS